MYLKHREGGQNIISLSEYITCKRTKFAYKLIHSCEENWNIIGKYWFEKLDDKDGTDSFLCQCSCLKKSKFGNYPELLL